MFVQSRFHIATFPSSNSTELRALALFLRGTLLSNHFSCRRRPSPCPPPCRGPSPGRRMIGDHRHSRALHRCDARADRSAVRRLRRGIQVSGGHRQSCQTPQAAGPPFQDGSGSDCAKAAEAKTSAWAANLDLRMNCTKGLTIADVFAEWYNSGSTNNRSYEGIDE